MDSKCLFFKAGMSNLETSKSLQIHSLQIFLGVQKITFAEKSKILSCWVKELEENLALLIQDIRFRN